MKRQCSADLSFVIFFPPLLFLWCFSPVDFVLCHVESFTAWQWFLCLIDGIYRLLTWSLLSSKSPGKNRPCQPDQLAANILAAASTEWHLVTFLLKISVIHRNKSVKKRNNISLLRRCKSGDWKCWWKSLDVNLRTNESPFYWHFTAKKGEETWPRNPHSLVWKLILTVRVKVSQLVSWTRSTNHKGVHLQQK